MAALEGHMKLVRSFSHFVARFSRNLGREPSRKLHISSVNCTTVTGGQKTTRDTVEIFLRDDVQKLLHRITRPQATQIFSKHIISDDIVPAYKILTDEELKNEQDAFEEMSKDRLTMPPYMEVRKPCEKVIAKDSELEGIMDSKYTFTDISDGRANKDRIITVRHLDGSLSTADWETRDRMLQIYYPRDGRASIMPKMFEDEYLEKLLTQKKYVYVLERACVQFEPDDQQFVRVTRRIYEHVFQHRDFNQLRSSRFFGPMSFYYCQYKKIEPLLIDMVKKNLVQDAADLVTLYHIIQFNHVPKETNVLKVTQMFCQKQATQKYKSELLEAMRDFVVNYKVFKRVQQDKDLNF